MTMRWILASWCEAYQHTDSIVFTVYRQQFDGNAGGGLLPVRVGRHLSGWQERLLADLLCDSICKAPPQQLRGAQYVRWPTHKRVDDRAKCLHFPATFLTNRDLSFRHIHFTRRQGIKR